MANSISINPVLTTTSYGTFSVQSDGLFQGTAFDDPAVRNALAGGVLSVSETLPMWGGVAIYESVAPAAGFDVSLGGQIGRALSLTGSKALTGFSVFNQAHGWITSPQSPVPQASGGMGVPFYRMGSGARIAVAVNPSLVTLEGGLITQQVSWDFNNQALQPYDAATATYALSSVTWNNTSGGQAVIVASVATLVGGVGDVINISGATNAGTGGVAAVNGNFIVVAYTDSQHFTVAMPAAAGVVGAIAGAPVLNYGVGALPVKVLQVQVGNSYTVNYSANSGFTTWNTTGAAAVIQI